MGSQESCFPKRFKWQQQEQLTKTTVFRLSHWDSLLIATFAAFLPGLWLVKWLAVAASILWRHANETVGHWWPKDIRTFTMTEIRVPRNIRNRGISALPSLSKCNPIHTPSCEQFYLELSQELLPCKPIGWLCSVKNTQKQDAAARVSWVANDRSSSSVQLPAQACFLGTHSAWLTSWHSTLLLPWVLTTGYIYLKSSSAALGMIQESLSTPERNADTSSEWGPN